MSSKNSRISRRKAARKDSSESSSPDRTLHIYTRVSTVAQRDEGTSLHTQAELGKDRAKELGFAYKVWDEGGKSSHHEEIAQRPKLNELYQAIKAGQVKHLFVYDQSRLSRNDAVASAFRYECNKQGVTLYTKDGRFDLSNPQDMFLKKILDGLAEFDNAIRADRTRLGKLNRARAGFWHGGPPPFGYKIQGKKLAIENAEAAWVQRIFSAAHKGKSPLAIKLMLDGKGVTPRRGGMWSIGSVAALLRNTHYAGSYSYSDSKSGEVVTVQCPAIIDRDMWQTVQISRKRTVARTQQKNPTTRNFYLIRDLMFCAHCGRPMAGRIKPSKAEALYYCPNKERTWAKEGGSKTAWKRGTGCGMDRSLNIPATDEAIFRLVQETHRQSSLLREEVKRRVLDAQDQRLGRSVEQAKALQARIKRIEKDLSHAQEILGTVEASFELGDLPKKAFEAKRRIVKAKIEQFELALNNAHLELRGSQATQRWVEWYKTYGDEVASKANLTAEQKKEYIEGLVERIEVRYDRDSNEHELAVQFRMPIVGDSIRYKDRRRKNLGYDLLSGNSIATVKVRKGASKCPLPVTP